MSCLTPLEIVRDRQKITGGLVDVVPCGKCPECLRRRQTSWIFRLQKEQERANTSAFLTLTYEDTKLPLIDNGLPSLHPPDHQAFIKRLRQQIIRDKRKYRDRLKQHYNYYFGRNQPIKYYAVGEYGSITSRPHYHSIIYNLPNFYIQRPEKVEQIWQQGQVMVAACNQNTIAYVSKYCDKQMSKEQKLQTNQHPEFSTMSKRIGDNFLTPQMKRYMERTLNPYIITNQGFKIAIPRYYRTKGLSESASKKLGRKAKEYALQQENYQSAKHELEYVQYRLDKHRRNNYINRQTI